jgi:undecaprenyl-diphosphatase
MEARLLLWVHDHTHPILDAVFVASHYAGTGWFAVVLVLSMAAWHGTRGERRRALTWLGVGAGVYLLQLALKVAIGRPRPGLWLDHAWAVAPGSCAFPSGHALMAAALYPLLALSLSALRPRARTWYWLGAVAAALWVGAGRVYLGVHWPSDVLAGWGLGAALVWLAVRGGRPDALRQPQSGA